MVQGTRLSTLYAVLDGSAVVRPDHLAAGAAVWGYCEDSARRIFGDRLGDPLSDELLRFLRRAGDWQTRTEIATFLGRHKTAEQTNRALKALEFGNLAECRESATGGRPAQMWRATTREESEESEERSEP